jgi:putative transposase
LLLTITEQAKLLDISRATVYYRPEISLEDVNLMHAIDKLYTEFPYYGKRRMAAALRRDGYDIGKQKVRTLMQCMGLEALYPKPRTSVPHPAHTIYPYLLRDVPITHSNQVWGTDITYIRLATGFAYLVAFLDWYSRYVISWQLSDTMENDFCIEALQRGLTIAVPEMVNSDQGSQFTSIAFTDTLKDAEVQISMDGRGRCMDNIFTERLWRSLKYEEVYPNAYDTYRDALVGIGSYFHCYNNRRLHQSLGYRTPSELYRSR